MKKNKYLIVVDVQNDFIDGALGTPEAVQAVPKIVEKIKAFDGTVCTTQDTHTENYLSSNEGRHLPVPHCIAGTDGHRIQKDVWDAIQSKDHMGVMKDSFGSIFLWQKVMKKIMACGENADGSDSFFELVGFCTDICVVSNALILKSFFPEAEISVDASCCAGTTPENHNKALDVMECCQIEIVNR